MNVRPPAAVLSRPVVAVRTPPALPRPIETRQAQAGGHLNGGVLVRPAGPTRPAQVNQEGRPQQGQDGFRPFTAPNGTNNNGGNNQVRQMPQTQPRTYEQQGNAATENRNAATRTATRNRGTASSRRTRRSRLRRINAATGSRLPRIAAGDATHADRNKSAGKADASGAGANSATGTATGAKVQPVARTAAGCASATSARSGAETTAVPAT